MSAAINTRYLVKFVICHLLFVLDKSSGFRCDRRPYGSQFQVSPSDGRFKLTVVGVDDNAYIPDQLYIGKFLLNNEVIFILFSLN